jgi:hypothetical protein
VAIFPTHRTITAIAIASQIAPPGELRRSASSRHIRGTQRYSAGPPTSFQSLQGADLDGAELQGASLKSANLRGASFASRLFGAMGPGAELQGATLDNADLQGADLGAASLQGASLDRANLQGAILTGADLQGASLFTAALQGASIDGAQLQGVNLQRAQLQGASLDHVLAWRADVRDADFEGARVVEPESEPKLGGCWMAEDDSCNLPAATASAALKGVIEQKVPEGKMRDRASKVLDLAQPLDGEEQMAESWAKLAESPPLPEVYEKSLLAHLRRIGCDATGAPYVAHHLLWLHSDRFKADSPQLAALASDFLDGAHCVGARGLSDRDKDGLRELQRGPHASEKPEN